MVQLHFTPIVLNNQLSMKDNKDHSRTLFTYNTVNSRGSPDSLRSVSVSVPSSYHLSDRMITSNYAAAASIRMWDSYKSHLQFALGAKIRSQAMDDQSVSLGKPTCYVTFFHGYVHLLRCFLKLVVPRLLQQYLHSLWGSRFRLRSILVRYLSLVEPG